jgi:hypothetical protein
LTAACALAAVAVFAVAEGASAATFYVDGAAAPGGDCLSTATACKTLADAIAKERATPEADTIKVAPGTYVESVNLNMAGDGGLAIVGAGAGSDPSTNTLLESNTGVAPVVQAQSPDTLLALRNLRVVVTGSGTGQAIYGLNAAIAVGRTDGPVVVDMANSGDSAPAITTSGPDSSTSTLDHVTIGGAWTGNALFGGHNVTVTDSRLVTGPTATNAPGYLAGPGTAFFQRTVVQAGNPNATGPVISDSHGDVILDSSEVVGGSGVYTSGGGSGESHTLTIASSTIDAGVLGNRDAATTYPDVTVEGQGSGTAMTARIDGSILAEAPKSLAGGGGTASVTCTNTDVANTAQAASPTAGSIDCASGSNGNTFTASLSALFANAAPDYTLNPSSTAVDSVPESAIVLPAGLTASSTDLAGATRVVNGVGTCGAAVRDKGALELSGHSGVVPVATIGAPAGASAGTPVAFAGSAPNEPSGTTLTFDWQFSDGASASGQNVSHAFAGAGAASATLTVTAPGSCIGRATAALSISPAPPAIDVITSLNIAPSAFFARPRGPSVLAAAKRTYGAIVRYTGSQAATTTFTVQHPTAGRRQGKSCRKPNRKNRRAKACTRYIRVGSFKHVDKSGLTHFRFTGRVKGRALKAGRYRLQAIPRNLAGTGRAVYRNFRIRG